MAVLRFHGAWRITVVDKSADFEQRAVVRGLFGTRVIPGRPGATLAVDEESWTLSLEHLPWGRSWQPNVRTTPGPVSERDGVRSHLLTSSDCHFPGKSPDYVNFAVRLDQILAPAPVRTTPHLPAATQTIRTSSSHAAPTTAVPAQLGTPSRGVPVQPAAPARSARTGWEPGR
ncbi:hypothetical protein KV557_38520 [Kitasatospora aureofaciens]|uniref:hypothetical protein n=1 Tax=Kitasatospora aureofaciens TaxID=1894 RepID=UPI001C437C09|nr:hypothetical protein [Kitasatospora aureofaciens]MBV6702929.1 hypothetical protein [Kitasatospora aureofaciens]